MADGNPIPIWADFAAEVKQRHQQRAEHDPDRMQPSDPRHDDRGKAVAGRNLLLQPSDRPGDFTDPREAGGRSA